MFSRHDNNLPLGARLVPGVDLSLWLLLAGCAVVVTAVAIPLLFLPVG